MKLCLNMLWNSSGNRDTHTHSTHLVNVSRPDTLAPGPPPRKNSTFFFLLYFIRAHMQTNKHPKADAANSLLMTNRPLSLAKVSDMNTLVDS